MLSNCTKNLLNLKDLIIKNIKNSENSVDIYAELPISEQLCPFCGSHTSKIHDHYIQPIKDIPIQFKPTTIFLVVSLFTLKILSWLNISENPKD